MAKQKGLRRIILVLLISLSISCFSLMFFSTIKFFNSNKDVYKTNAAWQLNQYEWDRYIKDHFDSITEFALYEPEDVHFVKENLGGRNFKGKTIHLYSSISYSAFDHKNDYDEYDFGAIFYSFAGTFDGHGNTLFLNGTADENSTFCRNLESGGVIKNVRFKNCYISCGAYGSDTYAGIIAGTNNGTIENCIVENSHFLTDRYQSNCNIAAIVGKNNGTVQNCMVIGDFKVTSNDNNIIGNPDGALVYPFSCVNNGIIQCNIFNVNYIEAGDDTNMIAEDFSMSKYSYCYSSANQSGGLWSSATGGTSGTTWYYVSEYNDGWPMLRVFISWETITFAVDDSGSGGAGTVSPDSIQIPKDVISSYKHNTSGDNRETLTILGQTVTATPETEPCHYSCSWTKVDNNSFTVKFSKHLFRIKFSEIQGATITRKNEEPDAGYQVRCGTQITVSYILYKKEGNYYKSCTFKFKSNTTGDEVDQTVTYTITDPKYYISTTNIGSGKTIHYTDADAENKVYLKVFLELKTYEIIW